MLYGFFDESGIHAGAKILTVGGWIASEEEWEAFARQWRTTLKRAGVSAFHFVDFNHSTKEFEGWTPRWKEEVLRQLFSVIERRDLMGVSGAIVMDDFNSVVGSSSGTVLHEKHGPYWVSLQYCVEVISKRVNDEVLYCLDRQQEFDSPLRDSFHSLKVARTDYAPMMAGITFASKFDYPELQAADLLVGETAKSLHNRLYDPERPLRKSFIALLEMRKKLVGGYFDREGIRNLLAMAQQPSLRT
jgi:Protein of unknown function (DUF3800)